MANFISDFMNGLSTPIFGIPFFWFILILCGIIFLVWRFSKKEKPKEFKRTSMYALVKENYDGLFKNFSVYANLPYMLHMSRHGIVKAYMIIHWNRNMSYIDNLKANENINKTPELQKNLDNENTQKLYALKIVNSGLWNKLMFSMGFGYGIKKSWCYHLIPEQELTIKHDEVSLNPYLEPQPYYDTFIYSVIAKDYTDNISFRANREQELEELSNIVPKQTYLELEQSKKVEQLDILSESLKQSDKDRVEQIRKAKI
jgi:hypothetical protein